MNVIVEVGFESKDECVGWSMNERLRLNSCERREVESCEVIDGLQLMAKVNNKQTSGL